MLYTDDYILEVPDEEELRHIIDDSNEAGLDITEEGYIVDFLGFSIDNVYSETYHLSPPQLINQIFRHNYKE